MFGKKDLISFVFIHNLVRSVFRKVSSGISTMFISKGVFLLSIDSFFTEVILESNETR
jgi:hypothetical protein